LDGRLEFFSEDYRRKHTGRYNVVRQSTFLAIALALIAASVRGAPPAKLALEGGRIIPVVGEVVPKGTILIEHGKITAIGQKVDIPYDAMVVDVSGKVLLPGPIVAHTSSGLDRSNENLPVTPFLDVYDALDPSSLYFEDSLRDGHLAIHVSQGDSCVIGGLSRVVRPIGRTTDEMTIQPTLALKLCTSPKSGYDRMTQMATMRETFLELDYYLENLAEKRYEEKLKEEKKDIDVSPEEARKRGADLIRDEHLDDKHRNLVKLTEGRLDAWIYCGSAMDVAPAIHTAKENGFLDRTVLVLGTTAYRAAEELKKAGRPVVLSSTLVHQERHPITGELSETFVPKVIHDAGLLYALLPSESSSVAERYLTYQAARCVRHGIPRQAALEAITLNPAKMLGVEDRLGSLEVGKAAYIAVLSGDPLDFNSWVEKAYIEGILAYDRQSDVRLKELIGVARRAAEKAEAEKAEAEEEEKEEEEEKTDDDQQKPKEEPAKEKEGEEEKPKEEKAEKPVKKKVEKKSIESDAGEDR
jgi:imidazolonepropionase-like amidohydrolase